jgi:hypothetical protein
VRGFASRVAKPTLLRFRLAARGSFMRRAQQAQFLANRGGGVSDLVDGALQFIFRDAEMLGPVMDFMRLAHGNVAAVALAFIEQIVTHAAALTDEKDPALGKRRGLDLPCRDVRFGENVVLSMRA